MKFRILDAQWHIGHQYEMLKFPFVEWSWLLHYKRARYSDSHRGNLDDRFNYVTEYEPGKYDAVILHLDQECLHPASWHNGKGALYRELDELIQDVPKIVIMHGTPHHPEAVEPYSTRRWLVRRLKHVLGNNFLVVNSRQAARQWHMGMPIIHGLDEHEWFDLRKNPRVITTISSGGMPSYYDRPFLAEVKRLLQKRDIVLCHVGVDFVPANWQSYREFIGGSLIYFNPTLESPMPRARTEAMFSGCCIVTTPHHDAQEFIDHGENGFLVARDPDLVCDLVEQLIADPQRAAAIGQRGRATALKEFQWDRFATDWNNLLHHVIGQHREARERKQHFLQPGVGA